MDEIIKIRVDLADKAMFEAAAKREGLSLSAWARQILRHSVVPKITESMIDPEILKILKGGAWPMRSPIQIIEEESNPKKGRRK